MIKKDLECYRYCEDIVDQQIELDEEVYDELKDTHCFTEDWEERLDVAKETQDDFLEFLNQLMLEAMKRIEVSSYLYLTYPNTHCLKFFRVVQSLRCLKRS